MTTDINSVFPTIQELRVSTDDGGNIIMNQGGNMVAFPPELVSNVIDALTEAAKGNR